MAHRLKKFGIFLDGNPIVIKTDMRKCRNEHLYELNDEDLLKYISHLKLELIPYTNPSYNPNNYHFTTSDEDVCGSNGYFCLYIKKCYYTYQLRFTDYDTTIVKKGICCIM